MTNSEPLAEGEQLVLRLHAHGKTMLWPATILVLIAVAASVVMIVLPASTPHQGVIRLAVAVVALVAAITWFGVPFLRWRTTSYELTTRRLRLRSGIISRTGRDFPLSRISDVSFSQGLIDRMLGCGRLIVESPGEQGQLILNELPGVQRVQEALFELVGDEARRSGVPGQSGQLA